MPFHRLWRPGFLAGRAWCFALFVWKPICLVLPPLAGGPRSPSAAPLKRCQEKKLVPLRNPCDALFVSHPLRKSQRQRLEIELANSQDNLEEGVCGRSWYFRIESLQDAEAGLNLFLSCYKIIVLVGDAWCVTQSMCEGFLVVPL